MTLLKKNRNLYLSIKILILWSIIICLISYYFHDNVDGGVNFALDVFYLFPAVYGLWIGFGIVIWRTFRKRIKAKFIYIFFGILNLHSVFFALTLIILKFTEIKPIFEGLLLNFLVGIFITIDFLLIPYKTIIEG